MLPTYQLARWLSAPPPTNVVTLQVWKGRTVGAQNLMMFCEHAVHVTRLCVSDSLKKGVLWGTIIRKRMEFISEGIFLILIKIENYITFQKVQELSPLIHVCYLFLIISSIVFVLLNFSTPANHKAIKDIYFTSHNALGGIWSSRPNNGSKGSIVCDWCGFVTPVGLNCLWCSVFRFSLSRTGRFAQLE